MRKFVGWIVFLVGSWMLVSPQALLGLRELKWMTKFAFPGEVLVGIVVISVAYYLLKLQPSRNAGKVGH
jgi:hypothetical protein